MLLDPEAGAEGFSPPPNGSAKSKFPIPPKSSFIDLDSSIRGTAEKPPKPGRKAMTPAEIQDAINDLLPER
ncbi:MAG TPA: hypothetical protein VMW29_03800 [Candidatus Bathyarchaeia archaeon]|nr:hypothetical protein [Candidatus Bathyarchaeia archaeon]